VRDGVVLWNTAAMAKLDTHIIGIPDWVERHGRDTEQREALMSFYSSLHGWTWEVGGENMGYYSIAHSEAPP